MTAVNAGDVEKSGRKTANGDYPPIKIFRLRIIAMALIVSLGGLIFGYDTGTAYSLCFFCSSDSEC